MQINVNQDISSRNQQSLLKLSNTYFELNEKNDGLLKKYKGMAFNLKKEFSADLEKIQKKLSQLNTRINNLFKKISKENINIRKELSNNNQKSIQEINNFKKLLEKNSKNKILLDQLETKKREITQKIKFETENLALFRETKIEQIGNKVIKISESQNNNFKNIVFKIENCIIEIEKTTIKLINSKKLTNYLKFKIENETKEEIKAFKKELENIIFSTIFSDTKKENTDLIEENIKLSLSNYIIKFQKKIDTANIFFLKKFIKTATIGFLLLLQYYLILFIKKIEIKDEEKIYISFLNNTHNITTGINETEKINTMDFYPIFCFNLSSRLISIFIIAVSMHIDALLQQKINLKNVKNLLKKSESEIDNFMINELPDHVKKLIPLKIINKVDSNEINQTHFFRQILNVLEFYYDNYDINSNLLDLYNKINMPSEVSFYYENNYSNSTYIDEKEKSLSAIEILSKIENGKSQLQKAYRFDRNISLIAITLINLYFLYCLAKLIQNYFKNTQKKPTENLDINIKINQLKKPILEYHTSRIQLINAIKELPKEISDPLTLSLKNDRNHMDFHNKLIDEINQFIKSEIHSKSNSVSIKKLNNELQLLNVKTQELNRTIAESTKKLNRFIHHQTMHFSANEKSTKKENQKTKEIEDQYESLRKEIDHYDQIYAITQEILKEQLKELEANEQKEGEHLADELSNHPIHTQNDEFREKINHCITEDAWHRVQLRHVAINDNELKSRLQTGSFQNPMGCEINSNANFAAGSYSSFEHAVYAIADASAKFKNKVDSTTFGAEISDQNEVTLSIKHDKPVGRLALKVQGKSPRIDCVDVDSSQVSFIKNGFDWKIAHIHPCLTKQ